MQLDLPERAYKRYGRALAKAGNFEALMIARKALRVRKGSASVCWYQEPETYWEAQVRPVLGIEAPAGWQEHVPYRWWRQVDDRYHRMGSR